MRGTRDLVYLVNETADSQIALSIISVVLGFTLPFLVPAIPAELLLATNIASPGPSPFAAAAAPVPAALVPFSK